LRREGDENCALLGHYTGSSGNFLPTVRGVPIGRVFRSQGSRPLKMGPIACPQTSVRKIRTGVAVEGVFSVFGSGLALINPFKTKRKLLYLKTQSVPRCKHFLSRL